MLTAPVVASAENRSVRATPPLCFPGGFTVVNVPPSSICVPTCRKESTSKLVPSPMLGVALDGTALTSPVEGVAAAEAEVVAASAPLSATAAETATTDE